jgi:hypothetical protein
LSKQSSTESGPSSSNRLSRQSSSETAGGGGLRGDPYQNYHGTPKSDHPRRSAAAELNTTSLPRRGHIDRGHDSKRRSAGNDDPSAIPLIEYSLVENGHQVDHGDHRGQGHYAVPDRARSGGGARPKVQSDNRRPMITAYDHANHIGGGRMGNHGDSEAVEAEESMDYFPDINGPRTTGSRHGVGNSNRAAAFVKYDSFANY